MPNGGADILLTLGVDTSQVKGVVQKVQKEVKRLPEPAEGFGAKLVGTKKTTKEVTNAYAKMRNQLKAVSMQEKSTAQTTGTVASKLRLLNTYQAKGGVLTKSAIRYKGMLTTRYKKLDEQMKSVHKTGGRTLASMAKWAMGWMFLYGMYRKVLNAIGDVIKSYAELDDAMARVGTVNLSLGRDLAKTMAMMRKEVLDYTAVSRAELTDVAKTLYFLGTAGLTVSQQMAGFENIMNLTIGTLGNIDEIGKLVAGSFNIFQKSLRGAITDAQKFKQITDILAYTYATQQVELSEIAGAFTLVGSAAGLAEIDFKTLVGTVGFLNTGMLKGTRAGTCYDDQTEVLTKNGFKFWKDVTMKDEFATLNPKTHQLEYQKPSKIIKENYEGPMYKVTNKHLDLCVTPNHWMYTKGGQSNSLSKYEAKQAKDIYGKQRTYIRGAKWNGKEPKYFILPAITSNRGKNKEKVHIPAKKIPIEIFIEFMGYYLSEGHVHRHKNNKGCSAYAIRISQSKKSRHFNTINAHLKKLPYEFSYHYNQFSLSNEQFFYFLKDFGKSHEKYIPQFIKNLNPHLLRIFLKAYNIGDGDKKFRIVTSSRKMRDDLEECALKAGYGVQHYRAKYVGQRRRWKKYSRTVIIDKHDIWSVNITNRTEFSVRAKRRIEQKCKVEEKWIQYSGKIYCCVVPNHIVFIRRNGKTVWCMQSLMNAFIKIARSSAQLTEKLGITFDPSKPMDFVDIMEKLRVAIGEGAISVEKLRTLMEIFGLRGARAITSILGRFEDWKKAIDVNEATFSDYAELMRRQMEDTLPGALKKLGNSIKVYFIDRLGPTLELVERVIKLINKGTEAEVKRAKELELGMKLLGRQEDYYYKMLRWSMAGTKAEKATAERMMEQELRAAGIYEHMKDFQRLGMPALMAEMAEKAKESEEYFRYLSPQAKKVAEREREFTKALREAVELEETHDEVMGRVVEKVKEIYGFDLARLPVLRGVFEEMAKQAQEKKKIADLASEITYQEEKTLGRLKDEVAFEKMRNAGIKDYLITQAKINSRIKETVRAIKDQKDKEEVIWKLSHLRRENLEKIYLETKKHGVALKDIQDIYKLINELNEQLLQQTREITNIFTTQVEEGLYRIIKATGTWSDMIGSIADELLKLQLKRMVHEISIRLFETPSDLMLTAAGKFDRGVDKFTLAVNALAGAKVLKEVSPFEIKRPSVAELRKLEEPEPKIKVGLVGAAGAVGMAGLGLAGRREQLEETFSEGGERLNLSIKDAFSDSLDKLTSEFGATFDSGSEDLRGNIMKGLRGGTNIFEKKTKSAFKEITKGLESVFGKQAAGLGGRMPGIVGGGMQMYQAFQTGGGGAGGAMMGAMGGGMMGMQLGGPMGAAIGAIAGGLLGLFGKKAPAKEAAEYFGKQVQSQIKLSNAHLEAISRNTSALNRNFERYLSVAPISAYFAETPGIESRFARERMMTLS